LEGRDDGTVFVAVLLAHIDILSRSRHGTLHHVVQLETIRETGLVTRHLEQGSHQSVVPIRFDSPIHTAFQSKTEEKDKAPRIA